ncbi:MAG: FG-GAP-like repeat-containing protein [bacterium]
MQTVPRLSLVALAATFLGPTLAGAQTFVRVRDTGPHVEDSYRCYSGAFGDFDADGFIDLMAGSDDGFYVYRNEGAEIFTAWTDPPATTSPRVPRAGIFGDYDNDGDLDVLRATFGDVDANGNFLNALPNLLFRNDGATFVEVPTSADSSTSSSATFVDVENDGDLDLFIPGAFQSLDLFYRNDSAAFTKLTGLPFLDTTPTGCIESWIDYDGDGDQDLYVVNHQAPNQMWRNLLVETGTALSFAADTTTGLTDEGTILDFAMCWGDYDNDGDLDGFLPTVSIDRLFRNEGNGTFTRILGIPLVQGGVTSSCGSWGDYDNDGDLDLFVPHAPITPAASDLWRNDGDGNFVAMTIADVGEIVDVIPRPQASEWADLDNDGDLDLYAVTYGVATGPRRNYLFRNEGGTNHWLEVDLEGTASNRTGVGAVIRAFATIGGQPVMQTRRVTAGPTSFEFQAPLRAHFGCGDATTVDSLRVEWPSGIVQVIPAVAADQILQVIEPASVDVGGVSPAPRGLRCAPNPFRDRVRFDLPRAGDAELTIYDVAGRRLRHWPSVAGGVVEWDGLDAAGLAVPPGVYFARVRPLDPRQEGGEARVIRIR